jgi:hypothetical protein
VLNAIAAESDKPNGLLFPDVTPAQVTVALYEPATERLYPTFPCTICATTTAVS